MVKFNFVTSYLVFLGAQSQHSGPQNDIRKKYRYIDNLLEFLPIFLAFNRFFVDIFVSILDISIESNTNFFKKNDILGLNY